MILDYLKDMLSYILFLMLILIISYIIVKIIFKTKPNSRAKTLLYGLFLNISKADIISYAEIYISLTFIIWSILFSNNYTVVFLDYHFYIILFCKFIFDIVNGRVIKLFTDLLNTFVLYGIFFIKSGFYKYMTTIYDPWYITLTYIMIIVFTIIYGLYLSFRDLNIVVMGNKYLKNREDLYED